MGLIVEPIKIRITGHTIDHYRSIGYECEKGDEIYVYTNELTIGAKNVVTFQCDYCGRVYRTVYYYNTPKMARGEKVCCGNDECVVKKRKEKLMKKYGVDNIMKIPEKVAKARKTCMERYGEDNPAKVEEFKEKAKNTSMERYGFENPAQNPEVQKKMRNTCLKRYGVENALQSPEVQAKIQNTLYERYGVPYTFLAAPVIEKLNKYGNSVSNIQRHICEVYQGQLSFAIGRYIADILLPDSIICEVDGSGHWLSIYRGEKTEEEFNAQERERERFIVNSGYKIFRIITHFDILPYKKTLFEIYENAKESFSNGYDVYRFSLDTGKHQEY